MRRIFRDSKERRTLYWFIGYAHRSKRVDDRGLVYALHGLAVHGSASSTVPDYTVSACSVYCRAFCAIYQDLFVDALAPVREDEMKEMAEWNRLLLLGDNGSTRMARLKRTLARKVEMTKRAERSQHGPFDENDNVPRDCNGLEPDCDTYEILIDLVL